MNADSDELDQQFYKLHQKYFSQYDCNQCRNCCKVCCGTIPVADLEDDAKFLHLSIEEFKNKYLEDISGIDGYHTKHTPHVTF